MKQSSLSFIISLFTSVTAVGAQPSSAPSQDDAEFEQEMQAMQFRLPLRVVGTVTDAETGEPVRSFVVIPGSMEYRAIQYGHAINGKDGRFESVNDAPLPKRTVRIEADGYAPVTSSSLSDQIVATFDAKLKKASNITGTVITSDGAAAANAKVLRVTRVTYIVIPAEGDDTWRQYAQSLTDQSGRFKLYPTDGAFRLIVEHDTGYADVPGDKHGASEPIRLTPWARIEGIARSGAHSVAAGETISIQWDNQRTPDEATPFANFQIHAVTDDSGRFVFDRVPPGKGTVARMLTIQGPSGISSSGFAAGSPFDAKGGETIQLDIGGRGAPVSGRFARDGGIPDDWLVHAHLHRTGGKPSSAGFTRMFAVEPDGRFRVEDLEEGSYQIQLTCQQVQPDGGGIWRPVAYANKSITIDPIPGGRSDEPLELGEIPIEATPPATTKSSEQGGGP